MLLQAQVIRGGDLAANALLYGPPDESMVQYFQNNLARAAELTGQVSQSFIENSKAMYDKFNNSAAILAAKKLVNSLAGYFGNSTMYIQALTEDNYVPNVVTQRYIMCHPEVGKLHKQNMCNGFSSTFYDMEPNVYGSDRRDYSRVMDGVLQFDTDSESYINYYSDSDDAEELSTSDKFAILSTWDTVTNLINNGKDPTEDIE